MSLKKIIPLPSQEYLRERFDYDPHEGILYWNFLDIETTNAPMTDRGKKIFNTQRGGTKAGHVFTETCGSQAIQVRIDGVSYYAHRVIYKWVHGVDAELVDHEDGDRLNNRIYNLRDVSNAVNAKNCKLSSKNTSGCTGVSWSKQNSKWEAYIWKDSKKYNLGLYSSLEEAIQVRKEKEKEFGYHENHGKR